MNEKKNSCIKSFINGLPKNNRISNINYDEELLVQKTIYEDKFARTNNAS